MVPSSEKSHHLHNADSPGQHQKGREQEPEPEAGPQPADPGRGPGIETEVTIQQVPFPSSIAARPCGGGSHRCTPRGGQSGTEVMAVCDRHRVGLDGLTRFSWLHAEDGI